MYRFCVSLIFGFYLTLPNALALVAEFDAKAGALFHFRAMAEWPEKRDLFNICTLSHEGVAAALHHQERQVRHDNEQHLAFPGLTSLRPIRGCQILFIGEREEFRNKAIISELGDAPVLTVTDSPRITDTMIVLTTERGFLEFDINRQRAERAKIRLDPQLLNLARRELRN